MGPLFPCYGVIPARFESSRFPGKPLVEILGKPMFWHVYTRALLCPLFSKVVLATDDQRIRNAADQWEVPCVMTSAEHPSGTDRSYEAVCKLGVEENAVVVNIQGDEPALDPIMLRELVESFADPEVVTATLATPVSPSEALCANLVKVVTAANGDALYFSRAPIPFARDLGTAPGCLGHIGIYAFRMTALRRFVTLPPSRLEQVERLEQLRLLENGIPLRVVQTLRPHVPGVDTPEDLEKVRAVLESMA